MVSCTIFGPIIITNTMIKGYCCTSI